MGTGQGGPRTRCTQHQVSASDEGEGSGFGALPGPARPPSWGWTCRHRSVWSGTALGAWPPTHWCGSPKPDIQTLRAPRDGGFPAPGGAQAGGGDGDQMWSHTCQLQGLLGSRRGRTVRKRQMGSLVSPRVWGLGRPGRDWTWPHGFESQGPRQLLAGARLSGNHFKGLILVVALLL